MKKKILYEKYLQGNEKEPEGGRQERRRAEKIMPADIIGSIGNIAKYGILAVLLSLAGTVLANGQLRDMLLHILCDAIK